MKTAELVIVSDQISSGAQAIAAEVRSAAGALVAAERAARIGAQAAGQDEVPEIARAVATQAMEQPAVSLETVSATAVAGQLPTGFTLSSPGMMVNFIMFSLMTAGMAVIMERKNGTLRRLMTTRVRR